MAGLNNECFNVGAYVTLTDCFNTDYKGEVVAFDNNCRMLTLRCPEEKDDKLFKVFVLNLSMCRNILVDNETGNNSNPEPPLFNVEKVKIRLAKACKQRELFLKSVNTNASPDAQELYNAFTKRLGYSVVSWDGPNIQIFAKDVTIAPPYTIDDVRYSSNNPKASEYVKKIMEHVRVAKQQKNMNNSQNHNQSASSSCSSGSLSKGEEASPTSSATTSTSAALSPPDASPNTSLSTTSVPSVSAN